MSELAEGRQRREAIIAFMQAYQREHRTGASLLQIADAVGLSGRCPVTWHIRRLASQGLVVTNGERSRTYRRYIAPPGGVPAGTTHCEIDHIRGKYIFWMES